MRQGRENGWMGGGKGEARRGGKEAVEEQMKNKVKEVKERKRRGSVNGARWEMIQETWGELANYAGKQGWEAKEH